MFTNYTVRGKLSIALQSHAHKLYYSHASRNSVIIVATIKYRWICMYTGLNVTKHNNMVNIRLSLCIPDNHNFIYYIVV